MSRGTDPDAPLSTTSVDEGTSNTSFNSSTFYYTFSQTLLEPPTKQCDEHFPRYQKT